MSTVSLPDHTQTLPAHESIKAPVIGAGAPIFDFNSLPANVLSGDTLSDFLVRNALLGDALANKFTSGSDVSVHLLPKEFILLTMVVVRLY
jgi:hypothetical protein